MEFARSINELNKKRWYRHLKVAFVLSLVTAQAIVLLLVRTRTQGEVIATNSYTLIGRMIKEDIPSRRGMGDEQAGREAYNKNPGLWAQYVEKYKQKYGADPVVRYPTYSFIHRAQFYGTAFVLITLFFEVIRRAFYYVIFGRIFPRKRRRKRRKYESESATTND